MDGDSALAAKTILSLREINAALIKVYSSSPAASSFVPTQLVVHIEIHLMILLALLISSAKLCCFLIAETTFYLRLRYALIQMMGRNRT